jgi:hypothetical protein
MGRDRLFVRDALSTTNCACLSQGLARGVRDGDVPVDYCGMW